MLEWEDTTRTLRAQAGSHQSDLHPTIAESVLDLPFSLGNASQRHTNKLHALKRRTKSTLAPSKTAGRVRSKNITERLETSNLTQKSTSAACAFVSSRKHVFTYSILRVSRMTWILAIGYHSQGCKNLYEHVCQAELQNA